METMNAFEWTALTGMILAKSIGCLVQWIFFQFPAYQLNKLSVYLEKKLHWHHIFWLAIELSLLFWLIKTVLMWISPRSPEVVAMFSLLWVSLILARDEIEND
jgi:hypothetical protein